MDHCGACGFAYASISTAEIPNALAAFGIWIPELTGGTDS